MKYKCLKCGTEFEAKMYVQCPKCQEQMEVQPIYSFKYPQKAEQKP
jgi:lipopolysaccharide biosynthesis regulator YciM